VRHYADEFTGVIALIKAHAGIGLIPRLAQHQLPPAPIALRPIAGINPVRQIGVRYRAGTANQPHIAPVLELLRSVTAELIKAAAPTDLTRLGRTA
jgi:DNA-binding transcriptional LysR family regulator